MAQQWLEHLLKQADKGTIAVESAGVFAIEGMPSTRETQRVLQDAGIQPAEHRSRLLTGTMAESADLILVMEPFHKEEILRRFPQVLDKVHLLKTYGLKEALGAEPLGIPDPIGKPLEVYEVCFATIREAVKRLASLLGANKDRG